MLLGIRSLLVRFWMQDLDPITAYQLLIEKEIGLAMLNSDEVQIKFSVRGTLLESSQSCRSVCFDQLRTETHECTGTLCILRIDSVPKESKSLTKSVITRKIANGTQGNEILHCLPNGSEILPYSFVAGVRFISTARRNSRPPADNGRSFVPLMRSGVSCKQHNEV